MRVAAIIALFLAVSGCGASVASSSTLTGGQEPAAEPVLSVLPDQLHLGSGPRSPSGPSDCEAVVDLGVAYDPIRLELPPLRVEPLAYGPRIADAPRRGVPASVADVRQHIDADELRRCYRWARFAEPDLEATLDVTAELRGNGLPEELAIRTESSNAGELVACVREVLASGPLTQPRVERVRLRFAVEFRHDPRTTTPPTRPERRRGQSSPAPPSRGACSSTEGSVPLPQLVAETLLAVTDYDAQAEHALSQARELQEWQRRGRRGRRRVFPVVHYDVASVVPAATNVHALRMRTGANIGRFRDCYRDALERNPSLEGTITLRALYLSDGWVRSAAASDPLLEDAVLARCLTDSLREVWIQPHGYAGIVEVVLPVELARGDGPPAPASEQGTATELLLDAERLLLAGDGAAALRRYQTVIAATPAGIDACSLHAGALTAALVAMPWANDARVDAEAEALIRVIADRAATDLSPSCRTRAGEALRTWATIPLVDWNIRTFVPNEGGNLDAWTESVLARFSSLAPVASRLEGLEQVPRQLAAATLSSQRVVDTTALLALLRDHDDPSGDSNVRCPGDEASVPARTYLRALESEHGPAEVVCEGAYGAFSCTARFGAPGSDAEGRAASRLNIWHSYGGAVRVECADEDEVEE